MSFFQINSERRPLLNHREDNHNPELLYDVIYDYREKHQAKIIVDIPAYLQHNVQIKRNRVKGTVFIQVDLKINAKNTALVSDIDDIPSISRSVQETTTDSISPVNNVYQLNYQHAEATIPIKDLALDGEPKAIWDSNAGLLKIIVPITNHGNRENGDNIIIENN